MIDLIMITGLGAMAQEIVHWYDLRQKLSTKRVSTLLRSKEYWVITIIMIVATPLCCWALFGDELGNRQLQFLSGAAFPLVFKKMVSTFSAQDRTNLGDSSLREYFLTYSAGGKT